VSPLAGQQFPLDGPQSRPGRPDQVVRPAGAQPHQVAFTDDPAVPSSSPVIGSVILCWRKISLARVAAARGRSLSPVNDYLLRKPEGANELQRCRHQFAFANPLEPEAGLVFHGAAKGVRKQYGRLFSGHSAHHDATDVPYIGPGGRRARNVDAVWNHVYLARVDTEGHEAVAARLADRDEPVGRVVLEVGSPHALVAQHPGDFEAVRVGEESHTEVLYHVDPAHRDVQVFSDSCLDSVSRQEARDGNLVRVDRAREAQAERLDGCLDDEPSQARPLDVL
jgi:hypothetical protein